VAGDEDFEREAGVEFTGVAVEVGGAWIRKSKGNQDVGAKGEDLAQTFQQPKSAPFMLFRLTIHTDVPAFSSGYSQFVHRVDYHLHSASMRVALEVVRHS
jgi:hypothetical protein